MDKRLQESMLLFRFRLGSASDNVDARHNFDVVGRAAVLRHSTSNILAEVLAHLNGICGGEDAISVLGREFSSNIRRAGLKNDGVTLGGSSNIQWSAYLEVL